VSLYVNQLRLLVTNMYTALCIKHPSQIVTSTLIFNSRLPAHCIQLFMTKTSRATSRFHNMPQETDQEHHQTMPTTSPTTTTTTTTSSDTSVTQAAPTNTSAPPANGGTSARQDTGQRGAAADGAAQYEDMQEYIMWTKGTEERLRRDLGCWAVGKMRKDEGLRWMGVRRREGMRVICAE
jgi:hypothetical protein